MKVALNEFQMCFFFLETIFDKLKRFFKFPGQQ